MAEKIHIRIKKVDLMKIILFGASGMVGQGVLRECLLDAEITEVLSVGRSPLGIKNPKLKELVTKDLTHLERRAGELKGYDACLFTLGATSAGQNEADYARINHDLPLAIAQALLNLNPGMAFGYVSGAGTDASEKGPVMWARVKGRTENDLMKLPFKSASMYRPGMIIAKNGEVSGTRLYRVIYNLTKPMHKLIENILPKYIVTTEQVGRAMIQVAKTGTGPGAYEISDIQELGGKKPDSL